MRPLYDCRQFFGTRNQHFETNDEEMLSAVAHSALLQAKHDLSDFCGSTNSTAAIDAG